MMEQWVLGKWGTGLLAEFLLTWKLIMLTDKELAFKINIPIFHHSIIPCAGQNVRPQKLPLISASYRISET